ncbi:MAG: LacI family DNA-binding transcriptional regulator [Candidatus Schmidhempelia sp.]|nr:LacI family DNA-binding transcriptional regulator [Candidatus Schmidhempelia sp.]
MKKIKTVTMQDIAKHAKVSVATVSRVLNTPSKTSIFTRNKVDKAIAELDYDTKALIKPYDMVHHSKKILVIDNQYLARGMINRGIEHKAYELGYKLLYLRFLFFTQEEIQQIITYTIHHQIEGIILINDCPYLEQFEQYREALPPVILLNHYSRYFSCVYFDHLSIAYQATDYLIKQGHKHIACLIGLPEKQSTHYLVEGYQLALKHASINQNSAYLHYQCVDFYSAQSLFKSLSQQPIMPTAIFCYDNCCLNYHDQYQMSSYQNNDTPTYTDENSIINGLLSQAKKQRYMIPQQLSLIATLPQINHQTIIEPQVTYMYKPMYQMGQQGLLLLLSLIKKQTKQYQSIIINNDMIIRHSVANKNQ